MTNTEINSLYMKDRGPIKVRLRSCHSIVLSSSCVFVICLITRHILLQILQITTLLLVWTRRVMSTLMQFRCTLCLYSVISIHLIHLDSVDNTVYKIILKSSRRPRRFYVFKNGWLIENVTWKRIVWSGYYLSTELILLLLQTARSNVTFLHFDHQHSIHSHVWIQCFLSWRSILSHLAINDYM